MITNDDYINLQNEMLEVKRQRDYWLDQYIQDTTLLIEKINQLRSELESTKDHTDHVTNRKERHV